MSRGKKGGHPARKATSASTRQSTAAHSSSEADPAGFGQLIEFEQGWAGPLPPPEVLREYGDVIPDLPERLVHQLEKEQDHRHLIERRHLRNASFLTGMGVVGGVTVALAAIAGGIYAILEGADLAGWGTIVVGVGGIIASTVIRYRRR